MCFGAGVELQGNTASGKRGNRKENLPNGPAEPASINGETVNTALIGGEGDGVPNPEEFGARVVALLPRNVLSGFRCEYAAVV